MSRKSDYATAEREFYVEPGWCVDLLLEAESFKGFNIWDPAAGCGTIIERSRAAGYDANGSDVSPRTSSTYVWSMDFINHLLDGHDYPHLAIICNPPFSLAEAFVHKAISLGIRKHAWLLQRDFPYSQRRYKLFAERPPATIWFLSSRPSCPPGEAFMRGEIEQKGGSVDYLWMVWDEDARTESTSCGWLLRPEHR